MNRDVNAPTASLRSVLSSLNINYKKAIVRHAGQCESNDFMIEIETKKGSYSIPCSFPYSSVNNKFKYENFITMEAIDINMFVGQMIFSVIMNMSEQEDEAVSLLFEGLCSFWDPIFKNVYSNINNRVVNALKELDFFMTKDMGLTEKVFFTNFRFFKWFVTGPLGNQIYYYGGLSERKDVTRLINGEVW